MGWSMDRVHGPGPRGGPWTRSIGWSMDPGPCFVYVQYCHGNVWNWDVYVKHKAPAQRQYLLLIGHQYLFKRFSTKLGGHLLKPLPYLLQQAFWHFRERCLSVSGSCFDAVMIPFVNVVISGLKSIYCIITCHLAHIFVFPWNPSSRDSEVEFKIERHFSGSGSSIIIILRIRRVTRRLHAHPSLPRGKVKPFYWSFRF